MMTETLNNKNKSLEDAVAQNFQPLSVVDTKKKLALKNQPVQGYLQILNREQAKEEMAEEFGLSYLVFQNLTHDQLLESLHEAILSEPNNYETNNEKLCHHEANLPLSGKSDTDEDKGELIVDNPIAADCSNEPLVGVEQIEEGLKTFEKVKLNLSSADKVVSGIIGCGVNEVGKDSALENEDSTQNETGKDEPTIQHMSTHTDVNCGTLKKDNR